MHKNLRKKERRMPGLPVQLVLILLFSLFLGDYVPLVIKQVSYAISLTIKEVLVFFLPAIVFSFLFSCITSLKKGALGFVLLLLVCICISTFVSTWIAYGIGRTLMSYVGTLRLMNSSAVHELSPLWKVSLPQWISNDQALFLGLILGVVFSVRPYPRVLSYGKALKDAAQFFLGKIFIPLVPLFIFGFALKLQDDGTLGELFKIYGPIFILIAVVEILYVCFLYAVGAGFQFSVWLSYLRNSLPSVISGFSTMSSAASLPMTLDGAEKNTQKPELVRAVIPATVNVHLVGDSMATPLMAFSVLLSFGKAMPDSMTYLVFVGYFMMAKFAVAAVPGGGIIVMMPILERFLGFTPEMLSLIMALYVIFDPMITAANVSGNGAFAVLFTRLLGRQKSAAYGTSQPLTFPASK